MNVEVLVSSTSPEIPLGTIHFNSPEQNIPNTAEEQVAKDETLINPQIYMQTVIQRRREFYVALGMPEQINVVRNYDIPLVRVMWEQMKTDQQKRMFMDYATVDAVAALGERYNMVDATPRYIIDHNNKLRYAPFPVEPFEETDNRCLEHYRNIKSPDLAREEAGFRGRQKIQEKMVEKILDPNAPVGFTMVVISGPGLAEGSNQLGNFIQAYILKQNPLTGQKYVEMVPLISKAGYPTYEKNLSQIRPEYSKGITSLIDIHYLENPIEFDPRDGPASLEEIFELLTGEKIDLKPNQTFQKFKEQNKPRVRYFLESVCDAILNPHEAAKRWQAVLAGADIVWNNLKNIGSRVVQTASGIVRVIPGFKSMAEEVIYLARQKVAEVMAACGLSGGFSLGKIGKSITSLISSTIKGTSNIVGSTEHEWFVCPRCSYKADGPVGGTCPRDKGGCGLTKEEYSQLGGQVC